MFDSLSPSPRVKPAIFDLLLAVCIAAYLGMMYLVIQVSHHLNAVVAFFMLPTIQLTLHSHFNGSSVFPVTASPWMSGSMKANQT